MEVVVCESGVDGFFRKISPSSFELVDNVEEESWMELDVTDAEADVIVWDDLVDVRIGVRVEDIEGNGIDCEGVSVSFFSKASLLSLVLVDDEIEDGVTPWKGGGKVEDGVIERVTLARVVVDVNLRRRESRAKDCDEAEEERDLSGLKVGVEVDVGVDVGIFVAASPVPTIKRLICLG